MNIKAKEYFDSLKGKKVAFVGMGVANVPCAEFCAKHGIEVYACDKGIKNISAKIYAIILKNSEFTSR